MGIFLILKILFGNFFNILEQKWDVANNECITTMPDLMRSV